LFPCDCAHIAPWLLFVTTAVVPCLPPGPALLFVLSIAFFSFARCGVPPNPHFFPTRRSSDLRRRDRASLGHILGCAFGRRSPDSDRKSTRLNSSHQITSYAVFCLKKKMCPQSKLAAISTLCILVPAASPGRHRAGSSSAPKRR